MTDEIKSIGASVAGSGGGCFRKGTLIQLEGGKTKPIEHVRVGDEILCFDESGKVSVGKVSQTHFHEKPEPLLRVKFWRGEIFITPNHWVLNQYGNFIDIGAMTTHDALVDGMGHLRPILAAEVIEPESVYNLTVEPHHTFIADGVRVHNGGYRDRFPTVAGGGGGKKGGKGGGGARAAIEDPDSLQSKAMVAVIDLLGEGEIGGLVGANEGFAAQSIFFNDTPVQNPDGTLNFQGVSFDFRNGTQNQEPMSGFSEVETPYNVGVKVQKDTPSTFTITNPNADEVRIILTFPSLITQDKKNGDIHGTEVQYKFSIAKDSGSFVDIFNANSEESISSQISTSADTKTVIIDGSIGSTKPVNGIGFSIKSVGSSSGFVKYKVSYWNGSAWIFHSEEFLERKVFGRFSKQKYEESKYVFIENTTKVKVEYVSGTVTKLLGATVADVRFSVVSAVRRYQDPILKVVGKSRSRYQRHHTIALPKPASSWRVRLTRLSEDSIDSSVSNDVFLDAYTEITKTKLAYPNSALVATRIDSSQFNSIPNRSYLIDGLYIRVPSNYDPVNRTYDGVWNGGFKLAISNNPAWVLYDLVTNKRYGLGSFIPDLYVDKSKLYQIGRYCDELVPDGFGGLEPRFTVNTTFQTRADAYKIISDLCSVFRGMAYWAGGTISFTQDAPSDPTMIFSQANVVDGVFSYQGSARKDRHSVAHITWNDPSESYKQKIEYVEDAELIEKYGIRKLDLVAFGCTSRGQAHRLGKWALFSEKFESDLVSFVVGLDAALVLPGDVIKIHDPYRSGSRLSGRIKAITSTSLTLDAPIKLSNSSSQVSFRLPDGTFVDRTVTQAPGTHEVLTWNNPLSVLPEVNTLWLVAEANLKPLLARVISIAQTEDNPLNFAITAVEHNPSKFNAIEFDLELEDRPTSLLNPNEVPDPEDLQIVESTYLQAPGVLGQKLHVSWFGSASSYELRYRRTGSNATPWETKSTTSLNVDLEGVQVGEYEFELYAKNYLGKKSKTLKTTFVAVGKTTGPASVTGFTIQKRITDLLLTWSPNTDVGVKGYEIRVGESWETGELIVTDLGATSFIHDQSQAGMYQYWIKAIDLGGRESEEATRFELWLSAPSVVAGFDCVQNDTRIEFRWNSNPESDVVGYEIREGNTWNSSVYIAEVSGNTYNLPASAVTGNRKFWIKAIASPGIYSDFSAFTTTAVAMASNRNVLFVQDEYALGFPGSKFNTEVVANNLTLKAGEAYGEYVWGVELPQQYRARNSIESVFDAVINDGTTWQQFSFRWNSAEAKRRWIASGDLGTVDIQYFIAKYVGIGAEYLNAFTLNNKLTAEKAGATVATQVGIQYQLGRFLQGLRVSDFTDVSWNYAIATTFNLTFWAVPKFIEGFQPWWVATRSNGVKLVFGYDALAQEFQLFDTVSPSEKVSIPFMVEPEDRVLVGIVQTTTQRKLYIGILNKEVKSAEIAKSAIGGFTKFGLVY